VKNPTATLFRHDSPRQRSDDNWRLGRGHFAKPRCAPFSKTIAFFTAMLPIGSRQIPRLALIGCLRLLDRWRFSNLFQTPQLFPVWSRSKESQEFLIQPPAVMLWIHLQEINHQKSNHVSDLI